MYMHMKINVDEIKTNDIQCTLYMCICNVGTDTSS